jgi:AcrR family transcriptional regulator
MYNHQRHLSLGVATDLPRQLDGRFGPETVERLGAPRSTDVAGSTAVQCSGESPPSGLCSPVSLHVVAGASKGKSVPSTARGRETRSRIVVAAAQLMFQRGAAGTTLDDVRAAAGVSSSQIYHYFVDKDALVRAVVAHQNESIVSVHEAVFANLSSIGGLRAWRDFVVEHQRQVHCRGGCPIAALGGQVAEVDPVARAVAAEGFRRWERAIRSAFEAMRSQGQLPADVDADRLAVAMLAALQGGLLLAQLERSVAPLEAALDVAIDHVESLVTSR